MLIRELNAGIPTLLEPGGRTGRPVLAWLGQAGFLIRFRDLTVVIDAYLSDSLAEKYRGTIFPHTRQMPPPIEPERLRPVDVVLCTHAHTDHMDPGTLAVVAKGNPQAQFVVPRAESETAVARGIPADRLIAINAGEQVRVNQDLRVTAIASAHETLQTDDRGNHRFLGYVLELGDAVIYHSGDCVPYPELAATLASCGIHLAILPVNGRDDYRRRHGVPGNFTFAEAVALCGECKIPAMLACHFGMFDFNTIEPALLDEWTAALTRSLECLRPRPGRGYELTPPPFGTGL
jgi:L-ascorbate metabolism protein UlaG (beta-lactamase superfamily)